MTIKAFWHNSKVGIIGGGSWGTVLAKLVSQNCQEVRVWMRDEESVRAINSTRAHSQYLPEFRMDDRVHAFSSLDRVFEGGLDAVFWALPAHACREQAKIFSSYFRGDEILIHATKGVEPGTMKRISEVLGEELPCRRLGVISGPNLAEEIARGEPAATVVASLFDEVCDAGQALLAHETFRIYRAKDVIGVEWAGALKNILAIASGALDAMKLGWNAKAMLVTRGLAEIVRFSTSLGGQESTFLGLAGMGDLMATCCSPLSRNYRVGFRMAQGEPLSQILGELETTVEGVGTAICVLEAATKHKISMPITEGVYHLIQGIPAQEILKNLMTRPFGG